MFDATNIRKKIQSTKFSDARLSQISPYLTKSGAKGELETMTCVPLTLMKVGSASLNITFRYV